MAKNNDFPENQLPKCHRIGMTPPYTKFWIGMAAVIPAIPLPAPLKCDFLLVINSNFPPFLHRFHYTRWPKMAHFLYALTSSNINRFSTLFHCQNQEKICNNIITKDRTTPHVCLATLPGEMSSVLKATIENETTSVTTHYTC